MRDDPKSKIVPTDICPTCGLTAAALHEKGQMGCADCYKAFAPIVAAAIAEIHRVVVKTQEPPVLSLPDTFSNPWPTRRAER